MDESSAYSNDEVEEAFPSCPINSCRKQFKSKKISKILKHCKQRHPNVRFVVCRHCSLITRELKVKSMGRHVKECEDRDENDLDPSCYCLSSRRLKEAKFERLSFSVRFCCMLCKYKCDELDDFNEHIVNHSEQVNGQNDENHSEQEVANSRYDDHHSADIQGDVSMYSENHSADEQEDVKPSPNTLRSLIDDSGDHIFHTSFRQEAGTEGNGVTESVSAYPGAIYPCPECGKLFTRKRSIKDHMVIHTGERNFPCFSCPYVARRQKDLDIHTSKVHRHERSFTCSTCSQQFGFLTNLKRHERVHDRLKPFVCQFCEMRFTQNSSCIRHCKKFHRQQ